MKGDLYLQKIPKPIPISNKRAPKKKKGDCGNLVAVHAKLETKFFVCSKSFSKTKENPKKKKNHKKREKKNSKVNLILSHVNQTFEPLNWTSSL
jgi:hypothetical protein